MARDMLTRLGYGKEFVNLVVWLVERHMRFHFYVANASAEFAEMDAKRSQEMVYSENAKIW